MFGWIKRKRLLESRKLVVQNFKAATDPEMPLLCLMKGGFDAKPIYSACIQQAESFASEIQINGKLKMESLNLGLQANKDLRKLFDLYGRKDRGAFDKVYQPLGGWDSYFDRCESDLGCIQAYWEAVLDAERKYKI